MQTGTICFGGLVFTWTRLDTVLGGSGRAATTPPPAQRRAAESFVRRWLGHAPSACCAGRQSRSATLSTGARVCDPQRRTNYGTLQLFFACALAGQIAAARRAALRQQYYSYACGLVTRQGARCAGRQSRSATLSTGARVCDPQQRPICQGPRFLRLRSGWPSCCGSQSRAPSTNSLVGRRHCHTTRCLLRRQPESQRNSVHHHCPAP